MKVEQLIIATVGFFWCFLMWFATAAFSPSIANHYSLSIAALGVLASSALWMAPIGRVTAGWAADRFGAPRTFAVILSVCGLASIASGFTSNYTVLLIERVVVAIAGSAFVIGIQHVSQWFDEHEIGTAEGLYAGTGNVGAGVGALLLPRIFGLDYQSAFVFLGLGALVIAAWYLWRGDAARDHADQKITAKNAGDWRGTAFVWSRYIAIALMLAYAMSFGLEIALNSWLSSYFTTGFKSELAAIGFDEVIDVQIAAGTFAAVLSFMAALFRPFAGFMSDKFQHKGWIPLPIVAKTLPYSPRLHWLALALLLVFVAMMCLTLAGLAQMLPASIAALIVLGLFISFGTGGTFALVPLLFPTRPGVAAGFVGGLSCGGGIVYPLIFANSSNIHMGYAYTAIFLFVPFLLFFFWAARHERSPATHGLWNFKSLRT